MAVLDVDYGYSGLRGGPVYSSRAAVRSLNVSTGVNAFHVNGYSVAGDGGEAIYKMAASEPSHGGKVLSGNDRWFELVVDLVTTVNAYGAAPYSTKAAAIAGTDSRAAIQRMIDHVGYYRLGAGYYKITDKLTIGSNSFGARFSGVGKEKSALVAVGMTGKVMVGPLVDTGLYRVNFSDHQMLGDADSCIDFTLASGQLYQSTFVDMNLVSVARPSFYANNHFATAWSGCVLSSEDDHSMEIQGGNSTVLTNCYAVNCGDGKAGFRIKTVATMISCVGLNQSTGAVYWGWFGESPASIYQVTIIGGNAEDFGTAAVNLDYSGQLTLDNFAIVARATGTYETFIKISSGTSHIVRIRSTVRGTTKGATLSGNALIQGTGAQILVENSDDDTVSQFSTFYNTSFSLLYDVPVLQVRGGELGKQDLVITRLKTDNLVIDGPVSAPSLPTSASGLAAGTLWNDGGTVKVA